MKIVLVFYVSLNVQVTFSTFQNIEAADGTYGAFHESVFGHDHHDVLSLSRNPENLFCQKIVPLG
jgi:hypothetical protein